MPSGNHVPRDYKRSCQISEFCDVVTIPVGSTLHQIFALDVPEEMGGTEQMIGELVLTRLVNLSLNTGDMYRDEIYSLYVVW